MTERENMPEISAAAFNMQANFRKLDKPAPKQPIKPVTVTCINCLETYNQAEITKLTKQFPSLTSAQYQNICLTCIKAEAARMKASYQPDLENSKESLKEITIAYQAAHNQHKKLAAKYQKQDYIENIINHHLTKPTKTAKPAKTKQTNKADAALKALKSLSAEKQAAILAIISKQNKS